MWSLSGSTGRISFSPTGSSQVSQVIGRVHPALLQFHGDESPDFCAQFGLPFVKAYRVRSGVNSAVDALEYLRPFSRAAAWLFDSHVLWRDPYPLLTLMAGATVRQAMETGEPFAFDHRVVHDDGSVRLLYGAGRYFGVRILDIGFFRRLVPPEKRVY